MMAKKRRGAPKRRQPNRISIVVSKREQERLADMAVKTERSMSWLGRYAVRRLLEEYESGQMALPLDIS